VQSCWCQLVLDQYSGKKNIVYNFVISQNTANIQRLLDLWSENSVLSDKRLQQADQTNT